MGLASSGKQRKLPLICVASNEDASERRVSAPGFAPEHTAPLFGRNDSKARDGNRERTVIMGDSMRRLRHPSDDRLRRQIEATGAEAYLDRCSSKLQPSDIRWPAKAFVVSVGLGPCLSYGRTRKHTSEAGSSDHKLTDRQSDPIRRQFYNLASHHEELRCGGRQGNARPSCTRGARCLRRIPRLRF